MRGLTLKLAFNCTLSECTYLHSPLRSTYIQVRICKCCKGFPLSMNGPFYIDLGCHVGGFTNTGGMTGGKYSMSSNWPFWRICYVDGLAHQGDFYYRRNYKTDGFSLFSNLPFANWPWTLSDKFATIFLTSLRDILPGYLPHLNILHLNAWILYKHIRTNNYFAFTLPVIYINITIYILKHCKSCKDWQIYKSHILTV